MRLGYGFRTGGSKAEVLKAVLEGPRQPETLPSQMINPSDGEFCFPARYNSGRRAVAPSPCQRRSRPGVKHGWARRTVDAGGNPITDFDWVVVLYQMVMARSAVSGRAGGGLRSNRWSARQATRAVRAMISTVAASRIRHSVWRLEAFPPTRR